jgi:peptide/nickel transport system substrate-binding protein
MNRPRLFIAAVLMIFLLASCGPKAETTSSAIPSPSADPTATAMPHADEIRFALIGNVTPVNVWALFDSKGYSYNNYAVMSGFYPRLYQLSIPDRSFEPMAASGAPSPVQPEGNFYTATVPLRSDLKWTDGTPFTADDVAFTVNTALSFQLGFDWHDFYNPDYLDHADAVDAHTVKFYFKKQPNVGVWQYGALQGPLVQKAYWESKVSASSALLPPPDLVPQIASLTAQAAQIQSKITELYGTLGILPNPSLGYTQTQNDIKNQQDQLNQTNSANAKAQTQYDSSMDAARQSLYGLDDTHEPTLGDWMPAGAENGKWINKVNPDHPFNTPKFDGATYKFYAGEDDAVKAFQNNDVDEILEAGGISLSAQQTIGNVSPLTNSPSYSLFFLVLNSAQPALSDAALRSALACVVDANEMTKQLNGDVAASLSFIPADEKFWSDSNAALPCAGLDSASRIRQTIQMLQADGYKWTTLPSLTANGRGFAMPTNSSFPSTDLIVSSINQQQGNTGYYVWQRFSMLGIPLTTESINPEDLRYTVLSSHQYDMAILGWRVSEYPGYLCDWFKDGNPFGYQSDRLTSACEALNSTSDLSAAQKDVYQIQFTLAQDLPFIPLYSSITHDVYRNVKYPFDRVMGGLSGIYGAPSLAIPAP